MLTAPCARAWRTSSTCRTLATQCLRRHLHHHKYALVFPGQGTQFVGMGADLWQSSNSALEVLQEADEALGFRLSKLMMDGPEDELKRTINAQPAVLVHSIALLRVLEEKHPQIVLDAGYVMGHSLGEYTALVAAKCFTLTDAVRLVARRGEVMQESVKDRSVGMRALFPCTVAQADQIVQETRSQLTDDDVCDVANINSPSQIVLSGTARAMDLASEVARKNGVKRCVTLAVSCPFHSTLLAPAENAMRQALHSIKMSTPHPPLVSNVSAQESDDPETIKAQLVQHVCAKVQWASCVNYCASQGVARYIEIGPRSVLQALIEQVNKQLKTRCVKEN